VVVEDPFSLAPKGAILKSHGETIAGLTRLLKDGPCGAAAERPVGDQCRRTNLDRPARCCLQEI
jgi:hypothetical protein